MIYYAPLNESLARAFQPVRALYYTRRLDIWCTMFCAARSIVTLNGSSSVAETKSHNGWCVWVMGNLTVNSTWVVPYSVRNAYVNGIISVLGDSPLPSLSPGNKLFLHGLHGAL